MYHIPVLVDEVVHFLSPQPGGLYIDATFGGGGHTRAILSAQPTARVIAFDWDLEAIALHQEQFESEFPGRITFVFANFASMGFKLKKLGITHVDGILADFGTSQHQIKHKEGFSFDVDTPLDMRMSTSHHPLTAAQIVNKATEHELATIFWEYGQERYGKEIARAIIEARKKRPLTRTSELAQIVKSVVHRHGAIHPATRVFQALRIVVNKELDQIAALLRASEHLLRPGGRMLCISFHSLEDRIVKHFFQESQLLKVVTKKVVTATQSELERNPSSRSAKLRVAEKI